MYYFLQTCSAADDIGSGSGTFSIEVALGRDAAMSDRFAANEVVNVNDPVYVGIYLTGPAGIVLTITSCSVVSADDPNFAWPLIQDG